MLHSCTSIITFACCVLQSSTEPVLAVEFHPSDKGSIVSCGKGQLTFWTLEGGTLSKKQGIYDVRHSFCWSKGFTLCVFKGQHMLKHYFKRKMFSKISTRSNIRMKLNLSFYLYIYLLNTMIIIAFNILYNFYVSKLFLK